MGKGSRSSKSNYSNNNFGTECKRIFQDIKDTCGRCFGGNKRMRRNCYPFGFTIGKIIVISILLLTLLFYGVGLYGLIIIGLLVVLLQFV
ncbi:MAG: hypothetical protein ACRC7N_03535 [Clostridium sp.]